MNRLLVRKKTRENLHADETTSPTVPDVPADVLTSASVPSKKKSWRRKKGKPEPEPKLDIRAALPAADNFRTSLMLPNLSTRFSMLKEQDDPNSMLGKASDDSVLMPKRRSRLGDFGLVSPHLSDIAEVSSLTSSVKTRTGAASQRQGSYNHGDGYGTDDDSSYSGSIMSRARPGEGNMLFGGRQKIYRIPIGDSGSVRNLGGSETRGMRGRALYEDDVSMSAFQRLREQERERLRMEREMEGDDANRDGLDSPSLSYNEKRETVSSTNSGPSMACASTAPTSVAASSPGLPSTAAAQSNYPPAGERAKSRKLYEQGLDQHMNEQHSAALGRLTSIKRNPSVNGQSNSPYRSKSASNIHDRYESSAQQSVRTASPAPIYESQSSQHWPPFDQPNVPPLPSNAEDLENAKRNALWEAMDPIDRGMATAMGTFNRPKKFDEQQFLQRQMSLLKQQPPPPPTTRNGSEGELTKSVSTSTRGSQKVPSQTRSRAGTNQTDRSWSDASMREEDSMLSRPNGASATVAREMQAQNPISNGTLPATDDVYGDSYDNEPPDQKNYRQPPQQIPPRSTFRDQPAQPRSIPPPILTHPAMRSADPASPQRNREKRRAWSPDQLQSGLAAAGGPHKEYLALNESSTSEQVPEPTPASGEDKHNIQGLIREHLRHHSNSSSIYPARTPGPENTEFNLRVPSGYDMASPWDGDDFDQRDDRDLSDSQFGMEPSSRADPFADPEHLHGLGVHETPDSGADWERELKKQHARGGSSETTYERQAFASELAQRQRTIQENLKVKAEHGTPSPTATSGKNNVFESSLKQFSMLRSKPSGESMQADRETSNAAYATNVERTYSKPRAAREGAASPPVIGRTLHSKLPRDNDESFQEYGPEWPRIPRPSVDRARPSQDSERVRQGGNFSAPTRAAPPPRTSPPESSRTSVSKQRSSSEASIHQTQPYETKNKDNSIGRPSVDNTRARRDSGNGKSPNSNSGTDSRKARPDRSRVNNLAQITTGSPRMSPIDQTHDAAYSTASTPPLSAASTSNMDSSATSASTSTNAQASAGQTETEQQERDGPPTGFFFPAAPAPTSAPAPLRNRSDSKAGRFIPGRKNTISKRDISEPTLVNSTSAVSTIELPPGASLQNGLRDDFDVVLMGGSSTAPAPSPNIPTGDKPRKGGFLAHFGRKDSTTERERLIPSPDDEPEPRRFRIRRLEAEERNGIGGPMHRAFQAGNTDSVASMEVLGRGLL